MSPSFKQYVNQLQSQIDGTSAEKADLCEEVLIHLELSSQAYMQAGDDRTTAEQKAMEQFGAPKPIGNDMQEAMFPLRKLLLIILATLSFVHTYFTYTASILLEGNAYIGWLCLSVLSSSLLLLSASQLLAKWNRKKLLNTLFVCHGLFYIYGALISSSIEHTVIPIISSSLALLIILFSIYFIFRTTIYDFQYNQPELKGPLTFLHVINLLLGVGYIGISLFFLFAFLIFSDAFEFILLLPFVPTIIWIIGYFIQIKCIQHQKKTAAYITACMSTIILFLIVFWLFAPPHFM